MECYLPNEIWLKISDELVKLGELRSMANLYKILNWEINILIFQQELIKHRNLPYKDYKQHMIQLWNRTGVDDGVDADYLKQFLNKDTRLFKTMWGQVLCNNEFYDVIRCNPNIHNNYLCYTDNIMIDKRVYNKESNNNIKYKFNICKKCMLNYTKELK